MKVLHLVDSLEPGGMENGVVNLVRGLDPGFEGHVACLRRRGAFAERLPVPERVAALGKGNGFSPAVVLRLFLRLQKLRPAVLHTHNLGPLIYATLATLGGRLCPIAHGEHSLLTADEKSLRRLRQRRRLFGQCRTVHTVAPQVRDELVALHCQHRDLRVIANGVDTRRFAPGDRAAARRQLSLPEEGSFIGIVGRFGPYKGHAVLLEAFAQFSTQRPDAHLLIVGAGGPRETAIREQAASHPAAARIHFTGLLDDPVPAYCALDLLALPSTNEGMANAALEAMACGIPVLGNPGCGHEFFIESGHDGALADLRTADALAGELQRWLAQPDCLARLGAQAREKVAARFSLETMMSAYAALYRATAGVHED